MLSEKQKKCAELLACGEHTQKEIAKMIQVSEQTICAWKKDDEFLAEYNGIIRVGIWSAVPDAFKTMLYLCKNAKSELVRFNAAKDILDRAGFKPEDNVNINGSGTVVIVDDCDQ